MQSKTGLDFDFYACVQPSSIEAFKKEYNGDPPY